MSLLKTRAKKAHFQLNLSLARTAPFCDRFDPIEDFLLNPKLFPLHHFLEIKRPSAQKFCSCLRQKNERSPLVYNLSSSDANPINLNAMWKMFIHTYEEIGTHQAIYYPFVIHSNKYMFLVLHFFFHFLPALLGDAILIALRKKPR